MRFQRDMAESSICLLGSQLDDSLGGAGAIGHALRGEEHEDVLVLTALAEHLEGGLVAVGLGVAHHVDGVAQGETLPLNLHIFL